MPFIILGMIMLSCTSKPNLAEHEPFIKAAIDASRLARQHGNHPFGAVLVVDGKIVLTAENTVLTRHDTTNHAELNLISIATQTYGPDVLSKATVYTSTEPCAMCAGAIYWAGIRRVVYACQEKALTKFFKPQAPVMLLESRKVFDHGMFDGLHRTEVIGPVLEKEAEAVHQGFW